MPRYTFYQLDVFTDQHFGGNPLAVFPDASGLTDDQMQHIALEMNLSETTFVFPPPIPGRTSKCASSRLPSSSRSRAILWWGLTGCWHTWDGSIFSHRSRA